MPYNYPDPENPGWTVVCYSREESPQVRAMKNFVRRQNYALEQETLADPMSAYLDHREQNIIAAVKRALRQPQNWNKTEQEVLESIKMRMGADAMPVVVNGGSFSKPEIEQRTLRKSLKNHRFKGISSKQRRMLEDDETAVIKEFDREFINLVRFTRQQKKISQTELGKLVNLTLADVRAFERGELPYDGSLKTMLVWKLEL
jgi:DNA-binding transcriptional regulator YiaG